jgi:SAM-dependent methyltransferase
MTRTSHVALQHYQAGLTPNDSIAAVLAALDDGENSVDAVDLAALDQFHAGGVAATLRLGELLAPLPGGSLLDAGSGLGGPARIIAEHFACHVTGVDLTPSYVALAARLSERTRLADSVTFQVGDLLSLPYDVGTFDGA